MAQGNGILRFDREWRGFADRLPEAGVLASMDDEALCRAIGADPEVLAKAVPAALREWRISPSRSLLNCLARVSNGAPSGTVFASVVDQTRFLVKAREAGVLTGVEIVTLRDGNGRRVQASRDQVALGVSPEAEAKANGIVRAFRAWEMRNRDRVGTGAAKLPKVLYRAVRMGDVEPERKVPRDDRPYFHWWKDHVESKRDALVSTPFVEASHSCLLSFTSNETVAEYFTRGGGFVVQVDPREVEVVASWATDAALDGKDQVSRRHEREWILRIPESFRLAPEDVRVHDRDWLTAIGSPLCVALFDHNDRRATYRLDGHSVEARFSWNSTGTNGSLVFEVDGAWGGSRATVRRGFGFDPLPTRDSVDRVEDFQLFETDYLRRKSGPLDVPGPDANETAEEPCPGMAP